jgi:hypothetical protein
LLRRKTAAQILDDDPGVGVARLRAHADHLVDYRLQASGVFPAQVIGHLKRDVLTIRAALQQSGTGLTI